MGKRREAMYPERFYVGLRAETMARVREASNRLGIAESVIVRRAVEFGLDRALASFGDEAGRGAGEPE